MRCPKCGYHSFDYLDNCKKCGSDLTEQKLRCKFQGYVAAPAPVEETDAPPEPEPPAAPEPTLPELAEAEDEAVDFGFDILEQPTELPFPELGGKLPEPLEPLAVPAAEEMDLTAGSGLSLDQPFEIESTRLPGDDLPKIDERFKF